MPSFSDCTSSSLGENDAGLFCISIIFRPDEVQQLVLEVTRFLGQWIKVSNWAESSNHPRSWLVFHIWCDQYEAHNQTVSWLKPAVSSGVPQWAPNSRQKSRGTVPRNHDAFKSPTRIWVPWICDKLPMERRGLFLAVSFMINPFQWHWKTWIWLLSRDPLWLGLLRDIGGHSESAIAANCRLIGGFLIQWEKDINFLWALARPVQVDQTIEPSARCVLSQSFESIAHWKWAGEEGSE